LVISIISLVFAAIAIWLTVRREVLDRPQLHVSANLGTNAQTGFGGIVFIVENRGRRPVTIGIIGLYWNVVGDIPESDRERDLNTTDPLQRIDLGPGQHYQHRWEAVPQGIPLDTPLRPYVEHSGGTSWGKLKAYFRLLELTGWRPQPPISEELKRHREPPLIAVPVEPGWKLWKEKELRTRTPIQIDMTRDEVDRRRREAERAGGEWIEFQG
jgi:hypothetical protein